MILLSDYRSYSYHFQAPFRILPATIPYSQSNITFAVIPTFNLVNLPSTGAWGVNDNFIIFLKKRNVKKYKVSLALILALLLLSVKSWSQKGYLLIDSAYSVGYVENQGKKLNTREVKFRKSANSPTTTYYPSTASEYGFNDKIYKSRKILTGPDSTAYFLYVLSKGNTHLYTVKVDGKKRFFIENETQFVELTKENKSYQQQISSVSTTCEQSKEYLPYLRFKEKELKRFFTLQNTCYAKGPWPLIRWSGVVGFSSASLTITNIYGEEVSMGSSGAPVFGFGVELPIGTRPSWFIMIQPMYQQHTYQKTVEQLTSSETRISDYDIEMSSISVPFQFKYAVPFKKMKGFFSLGPSFSYNLKNDSKMVEDIQGTGQPVVNEDNSDLVSKLQFAGAGGLGVEYFINSKISLGLEGRFSTGKGLGTDGHSLTSQQILVTINF